VDAGAKEETGPRKLRIAVIPKALDIPVFNYAKIGAERTAAELGNVEIIWRGPERADELDTERDGRVVHHAASGRHRHLGAERRLPHEHDQPRSKPVFLSLTWDSTPASKRLAFYGVDDFRSGEIMGEEAARLLGGKGTIAIITSLGAANLQKRLEGVRSSLGKHPDLKIVETYDIKEDPVRCAEIMATGTNRYPDLGAWIAVGGWPVFTRAATAAVPATTKVISFDTIPPAPELLKAGKVHAARPEILRVGFEPVKLLVDIIAAGRRRNRSSTRRRRGHARQRGRLRRAVDAARTRGEMNSVHAGRPS
jgi:ribose transport system substrate-binding protein